MDAVKVPFILSAAETDPLLQSSSYNAQSEISFHCISLNFYHADNFTNKSFNSLKSIFYAMKID
jgi:hypothetical protein